MTSASLDTTEAMASAHASAPRVTLDQINASIGGAVYFTAGAACAALDLPTNPSLDILTICVITMTNGFTLIGKSAPASPANFDAALGKRLAYDDAVRQVWPLMDYVLRYRLRARANAQHMADQLMGRIPVQPGPVA